MEVIDPMKNENLLVSPSPHIRSERSTSKVMGHVLIALFPAAAASVILFGVRALILILFCAVTAVVWERLCNLIMKRPNSTGDLSAVVTGVILAFNLPVTLPLWIAAIGTFVAIVITKQLFGGLGQNFANPAIVGRIVLMLSFPAEMSRWVEPFYNKADAVTSATPLVSGDASYKELFLGATGGCLGEVCAAALLLGGIYLVAMNIISPAAPLVFMGTVAAFSYVVGEDGLYQLLAGGVVLGAVFMATDYVTTPITAKGKVIFGVGCGVVTCVIRFWCSFPEGVSFSILLMNILTPYIDMFTRKKPIGAVVSAKKTKEVKDNEK